jgi:hypothetical protein
MQALESKLSLLVLSSSMQYLRCDVGCVQVGKRIVVGHISAVGGSVQAATATQTFCGSSAMVQPNDLTMASNGRIFVSGMKWQSNTVVGRLMLHCATIDPRTILQACSSDAVLNTCCSLSSCLMIFSR